MRVTRTSSVFGVQNSTNRPWIPSLTQEDLVRFFFPGYWNTEKSYIIQDRVYVSPYNSILVKHMFAISNDLENNYEFIKDCIASLYLASNVFGIPFIIRGSNYEVSIKSNLDIRSGNSSLLARMNGYSKKNYNEVINNFYFREAFVFKCDSETIIKDILKDCDNLLNELDERIANEIASTIISLNVDDVREELTNQLISVCNDARRRNSSNKNAASFNKMINRFKNEFSQLKIRDYSLYQNLAEEILQMKRKIKTIIYFKETR